MNLLRLSRWNRLVLFFVVAIAGSVQLAASEFSSSNDVPSYKASLGGGKSISIKSKNLAIYSLFGLSLNAGKNLTASVQLGVTLVNNGKTVVITSNANILTYSVTSKRGVSFARGKGSGISFSATSDNQNTKFNWKIDITAIASQLPQSPKSKNKPTLVGATNFTLIIGSAQFTGSIDKDGRVTFPAG